MSRRRVILDSEDDEEAISPVHSPQKENAFIAQSLNSKDASSVPAGTNSSTDPVLFQKIYNEQRNAALQESPRVFTQSTQLPALDDRIINQNMSSSPLHMSAKRVKRSRTMNPSSLTSVTSPRELQHKAKRMKSSRDVDSLTQVTSPGKSNQAPAADIWEFPSSNESQKKTYGKIRRAKTIATTQLSQSELVGKQKAAHKDDVTISTGDASSSQKRGSEEIRPLKPKKKTYAGLKRAKTSAQQRSSQSEFSEQETPMSKDDSHGFGRKRRASNILDTNQEPRTKKAKHNSQDTDVDPLGLNDFVEIDSQVIIEGHSSSKDHGKNVAKSSPPPHSFHNHQSTIQVPRTASEEVIDQQANSIDLSFPNGSSTITSPRMTMARGKQAPTSVPAEKSLSSISIVPATFSDSQKKLYETISIASNSQEYRSSLAEAPRPTLDAVDMNSVRSVSSSPPITTDRGKLKRAQSLIASQASVSASQASVSSAASVASKTVSKKKRSKTMTNATSVTSLRASQTSVDELSFLKSQELDRPMVGTVAPREPRKKESKRAEERSSDDELGSDKIGLPQEIYVPRPSRRRATSMGTGLPLFDDPPDLPRPARKKSLKASKAAEQKMKDDISATQNKKTLAGTEKDGSTPDKLPVGVEAQESSINVSQSMAFPATDLEMSTGSADKAAPLKNEGASTTRLAVVHGSQTDDTDISDTDSVTAANEIDTTIEFSVTKKSVVQVPATAPKPRGRPRNVNTNAIVPASAKSTKVIPETPTELVESLDNTATPVTAGPKAAAPAKRRGRPPKSTEKVIETAEELEETNEVEGNTLREDHSDEHTGNQTRGPIWGKTAEFLVPESTPPQQPENTAALSLITPTKKVKKGPDHSPLPSGKVRYRVGLSKKHKIEPLLKINPKKK